MKTLQLPLLIFTIAITILTGCATASRTNELSQGMTQSEVKEQMGDPSQTQFIGNKLVWKYTLLKPFVGMQPYYLIFDPSSKRLESWYMNEVEFQRNQQEWIGAAQSYSNQQAQEKQQREAAYQQDLENKQRQQMIDLQKRQLQQQQQEKNKAKTYKVRDQDGNTSEYTVEPK